jgi:16S rRNA (guanine527-N7)-methyltransferase
MAALALDPALATPLLDYLALLARWNKTYNLTAVRDPQEMVGKHLLDSLAMHPYVDGIVQRHGALADLGTGPGLPGIPLAIVKPGLRVTLVESNGKKARFLREAVRPVAPGGRASGRGAHRGGRRARRLRRDHRPRAGHAAADPRAGRAPAQAGRPSPGDEGCYPADEIAALPAGWALQSAYPLTFRGWRPSAT